MANVWKSHKAFKKEPYEVPADPWDARSLEWMIPSPVPEYNFDEIPEVHELDEFWHRKYGHDEDGRLVRIAKTEDIVQKPGATGIHLPSPSYWPIILSAGLPFIGYGVIFDYWWAVLGGLITVAGFLGWILEPSTDPEDHHADHGHGDHDAHQLEAGEEQPALVGSTDAPAAEASNEETSGD